MNRLRRYDLAGAGQMDEWPDGEYMRVNDIREAVLPVLVKLSEGFHMMDRITLIDPSLEDIDTLIAQLEGEGQDTWWETKGEPDFWRKETP